jgi:hypothetical protein
MMEKREMDCAATGIRDLSHDQFPSTPSVGQILASAYITYAAPDSAHRPHHFPQFFWEIFKIKYGKLDWRFGDLSLTNS